MIYHFCAKTDTGRVRANNEDSIAFDESNRIAVLADGMGGYNAGEIASTMATSVLMTELGQWLQNAKKTTTSADIRHAIEAAVAHANHTILQEARNNPGCAGMGTTLVVGVFQDNYLVLAHIGDSRCYRLRNGRMEQITKDHSLLQEQMDAGWITPAEAALSSIKNLVTRALGVEDHALLEIHEFDVQSGDLYLMCSDGLSDMMSESAIGRIASLSIDIEQRATGLINAANDMGGRDNISVLMVEVAEAPEKRSLIARWLGK
jgi:PPM family protein phosphatase